jgi:hypothetical protein
MHMSVENSRNFLGTYELPVFRKELLRQASDLSKEKAARQRGRLSIHAEN